MEGRNRMWSIAWQLIKSTSLSDGNSKGWIWRKKWDVSNNSWKQLFGDSSFHRHVIYGRSLRVCTFIEKTSKIWDKLVKSCLFFINNEINVTEVAKIEQKRWKYLYIWENVVWKNSQDMAILLRKRERLWQAIDSSA